MTEVVSWPEPAVEVPAGESEQAETGAAAEVKAAGEPSVAPVLLDEKQFSQRLLAEVQRQVELMLEVRLREALAPILSRAADALVRDARKELTSAMRDVVSRSIAEELAKRR